MTILYNNTFLIKGTKRNREDSPPPLEKHQKWATKASSYQQTIFTAVAMKRIVHGRKGKIHFKLFCTCKW